MFYVVQNRRQIATATTAFRDQLSRSGRKIHRKLSTPGGPYQGPVFWNSQLKLWSLLSRADRGSNRYVFWFGTEPDREQPFPPSIEINFHKRLANGAAYGRVLRDQNGAYWIAHKGGLGGGRASLSMDDFNRVIQGFVRQEVEWSDQSRVENLYILGRVGSTDLLKRLQAYVGEAERLRAIARRSPDRLRRDRNKQESVVLPAPQTLDENTSKWVKFEADVARLQERSLGDLWEAYRSRQRPGSQESAARSRTAIRRDPLVAAIAKRRANHGCEVPVCRVTPFLTRAGRRYMEVHHIVPLASGGPDTPGNTVCVCPSHHRELHFGRAKGRLARQLKVVRRRNA